MSVAYLIGIANVINTLKERVTKLEERVDTLEKIIKKESKVKN